MEFSESYTGSRLSFNKHGVVILLLIALMAFLHGCGDSPNGPDTEMIEKTINPTDGNETLTNATLYDDDSGETLGTGETTLKREKGASISVRVEADGFIPTTKTVSFQSPGSVEIALSSDEVTIDYRITDKNDELISSAELFIADTLASAHPEGSITLPYQEAEVAICGRAEYYEDACEEITLDESRELSLQSARKTVTYTITPEIEGYEDYNENPDNSTGTPTLPGYVPEHTGYILTVGDSVWVDAGKEVDTGGIDNTATDPDLGEGVTTEIEYPMGPENVSVHLRTQYFPKGGHEYSDNDYLNAAESSFSFPGDTDETQELLLAHIPACSDEVNNDFADGMDAEDPGCVDTNGNYDPADDVELLKVKTNTSLSSPDGENMYVSSATGEQEDNVAAVSHGDDQTLPGALNVRMWIDGRVESSQGGESFAIELRCGADRNNISDNGPVSPIIEDDGSDGWKEHQVPNIKPEFFENNDFCSVYALHATKVRGEDPGDGKDDIIFATPNRDGVRVLQWFYEPEDFNSSNQKTLKTKTTSDNKTKVRDKQPQHFPR